MYLSRNLQHLRKINDNMTQEQLAQKMRVSRQTISKWESGESTPELSKVVELCDIFSCTLDSLLREDLSERESAYLPVRLERVKGFRYAESVIISRNPREDSQNILADWCNRCALDTLNPVYIGWNFPYLSQEQKQRFGLHGYVSAVILPDGFEPDIPGLEISVQETGDYAVMTVQDPFASPSGRISRAYGLILEYLVANSIKKQYKDGLLPCFERVYTRDGLICMDVYINCQGAPIIHKVTELKSY